MGPFAKLSKTARSLMLLIGAFFILAGAAGVLVILFVFEFEKPAPYLMGLALGCISSLIKAWLLERALNNAVDMEKERARNYALAQWVIRYALSIAVLAPVVIFPDIFGLFGAILGILSLQISAYAVNLIPGMRE